MNSAIGRSNTFKQFIMLLSFAMLALLFVPQNASATSQDAADAINKFEITQLSTTSVQIDGSFQTWSTPGSNTGYGYWVIIEDGAAPSNAEAVKNHVEGTSSLSNAVASGRVPVSTGREFSITVNGSLAPNQDYKIYFVVERDYSSDGPQFSREPQTGRSSGKAFNTFDFQSSDRFMVNGTAANDGEYVRGVAANNSGQASIRFPHTIGFVDETTRMNNIQIRDTNGTNVATDADISGRELTINFSKLEPNQRYAITIQPSTLHRINNGERAVDNSQLTFIFFTEKKPNIIGASFEPGGHAFTWDRSPFYFENPDRIYHIDELIGVNKIGVGVNQALVLQFDDYIAESTNINRIRVDSSPFRADLRYHAEVNPDDASQLLITFDTDDPDKMLHQDTTYTVSIPAGALEDRYGGGNIAQNDALTIKFRTVSGFLSTFINTTASELNQTLFRQYNANNIAIKIPKLYVQELETIHYRQGLVPDERVAPNLTNVAITADDDVATIRLETNTEIPRLLTRGANNRFNATFAGLNADITEIRVVSYDYYGKLLEARSFRLKGGPGEEFQNDYVPQITNSFGQTVSLYELMSNQQILTDVLEQIPVSELDRIGVFAPGFAPYDNVPLY